MPFPQPELHIKRAVYQGGHCWCKMLQVAINSHPLGTGDELTHNCKPMWTTLPEASASSRELLFAVAARKGAWDGVNAREQP